MANNCCGLMPLRRATSDTLAPRSKLSTTMRTLSRHGHRRRRPMLVINSIPRTLATPSPAALRSATAKVQCLQKLLATVVTNAR